MKGSLIKSNLATIGRLEDREKALLREAKAAGGPLADEVAAARAAEKQMAATCAAAKVLKLRFSKQERFCINAEFRDERYVLGMGVLSAMRW